MYFYIINNGSTVSEERKSHLRRPKKKATTKQKASPKRDFTFFFIWQAIVRGRLFLQRTFFLLYHTSPFQKPENSVISGQCFEHLAKSAHYTAPFFKYVLLVANYSASVANYAAF